MYQLCRALAHIHCLGICHRDIKPQNLLVHPVTQQLKLCDFGSAKALIPGEPNVSYICSRYYRAPELIFGSTDYTTAIDIWSQGCVGAELLLGQPLFPGDSGVDQLVEIIKVLGTPTKEEIPTIWNSSFLKSKAVYGRRYFVTRLRMMRWHSSRPTWRTHPQNDCTHLRGVRMYSLMNYDKNIRHCRIMLDRYHHYSTLLCTNCKIRR